MELPVSEAEHCHSDRAVHAMSFETSLKPFDATAMRDRRAPYHDVCGREPVDMPSYGELGPHAVVICLRTLLTSSSDVSPSPVVIQTDSMRRNVSGCLIRDRPRLERVVGSRRAGAT